MSNLKLVSALIAAVGALCLLLVQFLPWASMSGSGFGASFERTSYTWEAQSSGSFGGFSGDDSTGWYSDDWDDAEDKDGLDEIRTAVPFLTAGLVVLAIGAVVGFLRSGPGGILILVAGAVALVGLVLFAMGTDAMYDSDQDWGPSFYLAIIGTALGLLGGVLAVVSGNTSARATA